MMLLGWNSERRLFHFVRDLTADELECYQKYTPLVAEIRNRLQLFHILVLNYDEWRSKLASLLNPTPGEQDKDMLDLDRLLLNYLSCAYTIQEHFKVSFQQRFRNYTSKQKEYAEFLDRLCKASWDFAFFLDFRGYVQHRGLGIGRYHRHLNNTSVSLVIEQDASELLAESKEWKRSKLNASRGTIDIPRVLKRFHHRMIQDYAVFVVKTFYPELIPATNFYRNLTTEVKKIDPEFRMVFHKDFPKELDPKNLNLELILVPNDVLGELGIQVKT